MAIEFDYEFVRNEKNETTKFHPDKIPTKLANLCMIEGPNDSGKSTLLHLIALGFYGRENNRITSEALKAKIDGLLKKNQKIKFRISLKNADSSLELVAEKKSFQESILVEEYINGRRNALSPKEFEKKYTLIYDIPTDPVQRLPLIANEVKGEQLLIQYRLGELHNHLLKIQEEISRSQSPKKISDLKNDIVEKKSKLSEISGKISEKKELLDAIEKITYLRFYTEYGSEIERLESQIEKLESRRKRDEGRIGRVAKKANKAQEDLYKQATQINGRITGLTRLLKLCLSDRDARYASQWDAFNISDKILSKDTEFLPSYLELITDTEDALEKKRQKIDSDEKGAKIAEFYQKFVELLRQYEKANIKIAPLGKNIHEFLREIEPTAREIQERESESMALIANINSSKIILGELRGYYSGLNQLVACLKDALPIVASSDKEIETDSSGDEQIIQGLRSEVKKIKQKKDTYFQKWVGVGSPQGKEISDYRAKAGKYQQMAEEQVLEKIRNLSFELSQEESLETELKNKIRNRMQELDSLEQAPKSRYQEHSDFIDKLIDLVGNLRTRFKSRYALYIDKIIEKHRLPSGGNPGVSEYNKAIFALLAKRIGTLLYVDKEHALENIDFIDDIATTKEGKEIDLTQMGTGRGQSAYLSALLASQPPGKKIIAMFDEVAMMDNNSLSKVTDKLKALYKSGTLLAGIIVQKKEGSLSVEALV